MTHEPQPVGKAISELIALRGFARVQGNQQLQEAWKKVATEVVGEHVVNVTRAQQINRGVLQIAVRNAPLLNELVSFHKTQLLKKFQQQYANLKIRDLKFRLKGDLKSPS